MDLEAYFQRIGYTGPVEPTLETLYALHLAHTETFVFENLNNWNNHPVSLNLQDIFEKMVLRKRGGYCFETNALFAAVLEQLGFRVSCLASRVRWMQPPESVAARTHMLLRVEVDGKTWVADVGFGAVGQTVPLLLEADTIQQTPLEARRYIQQDGYYIQQIQVGPSEWEDVYIFNLDEAFPADYEVANWYISTHPESLFRKTLLITVPRKDHRLILAFGEFRKRYVDGRFEKHVVRDDAELRDILIHSFGLPAGDPLVSGATLEAPSSQ